MKNFPSYTPENVVKIVKKVCGGVMDMLKIC